MLRAVSYQYGIVRPHSADDSLRRVRSGSPQSAEGSLRTVRRTVGAVLETSLLIRMLIINRAGSCTQPCVYDIIATQLRSLTCITTGLVEH